MTDGDDAMGTPDIGDWIRDMKSQAGSDETGMILCHQGIARGTARSGRAGASHDAARRPGRLEEALAAAKTWLSAYAVRGWVNEGSLSVGDDIMKVLAAGDIRDNLFAALQQLVSLIKDEVITELETH